MSEIDHDRLNQVTTWAPYLMVDNLVSAELAALRRTPKCAARTKHLERHVAAGEVICDCYEKARADMLGR